jgi:DNA-binding NtrC family response regulator
VKTILIVEDDEHQIRILSTLLTSKGYRTVQANSLDEAHATLRDFAPDLLILDVWLGWEHGLDLLNYLVVTDREFPVVVITGDPDAVARYPASARAVAGWVHKPVHLNDILSIVERTLGPA